jgi:hypothetical protein
MKEGEDYIITGDPESTDDFSWTLILKKGVYKDFIIRISDIEILENDMRIDYYIETLFIPEDMRLVDVDETVKKEYNDYCNDLVEHIMRDFDNRKINKYFSKKTGERIEY